MLINIRQIASVIILLFLVNGLAFSQSSCKNYHIKKCGGYGSPFKYSGQSKSANFELGETSSFKMSAFGGFEYSISLCAERQLKGMFFRIKESENSVLYDSQADGVLDKQFYVEDSKVLLVEVVVPEGKTSKDIAGCVGVIIEYRKVE